MNQTGKYIVYLLFGLLTATAFISSCTDGNEQGGINPVKDKVSLSISFQSEQHLRAGNGLRANEGGEIDPDVFDRESTVYSLAVFVFDGNKLDGSKFIDRTIKAGTNSPDKAYKEITKIEEIELTAGVRDVYIIANAPDDKDGHFNSVTDFDSFKAMMEELSKQEMYGHDRGGTTDPNDPPIGGVDPDDRFTNLVMTQSFKGLQLNSGAPKHYLGYTDGVPVGETGMLVNGTNPVELVRLVARVAIQKITFDLPATLTFDPGILTSNYNHYVDTVFMINAKIVSSYFPEDNTFPNPGGSFGHGNTTGYNYLRSQFSNIPDGSTYTDYLYIPINFKDYDITGGHVPLWFYTFENKDSGSFPTGFVIGVKYQYINPGESVVKAKKVYYPVVVNVNGSTNGAGHNFIKRNNQYGIRVTIKKVGSYMTDYSGLRSTALRAMNILSEEGVVEIEETVGPDLFPWTGNVYK